MKNTAFRRTISMLIALTFVLSCASSAFAFNIGTRRDDIFSGKNQFGEGIVQEQHEVTSPTNLLNEDGTVKEPGWEGVADGVHAPDAYSKVSASPSGWCTV